MAVGLVIILSLEPAARAVPTDPCPPETDYGSPEANDFVSTGCVITQAVFGDNDITVGYRLESAPAVVGQGYTATDAYGRDAIYIPIMSMPLDLKAYAPSLFTQGAEAYATAGTLSGPAGKINIVGVSVLPKGITSDEFHVLLYSDVLTDEQFDALSVSARISAGARVVDADTGQSYPLSKDIDAVAMWGSPSDMSTLYGTMGQGGIDENCVRAAYARYDARVKSAMSSLNQCEADAMLNMAICMAAIFVGTLWCAPIAIIGATIVCTAALAVSIRSCMANYFGELDTDSQLLQAELIGCGVVLYEQ